MLPAQHASAGEPTAAVQVLRRAERAGAGGVRRRFRELSMLVHPDKCPLPGAQKVCSCYLALLYPAGGAQKVCSCCLTQQLMSLLWGGFQQRSPSPSWCLGLKPQASLELCLRPMISEHGTSARTDVVRFSRVTCFSQSSRLRTSLGQVQPLCADAYYVLCRPSKNRLCKSLQKCTLHICRRLLTWCGLSSCWSATLRQHSSSLRQRERHGRQQASKRVQRPLPPTTSC